MDLMAHQWLFLLVILKSVAGVTFCNVFCQILFHTRPVHNFTCSSKTALDPSVGHVHLSLTFFVKVLWYDFSGPLEYDSILGR